MPRKKSVKTKSRNRNRKPGIAGWAIIFSLVFIMVFVLSMVLTPSKVTVAQPERGIVRVQILNGCGADRAVDDISKALMNNSSQLFFDIIDRGNADLFSFEKTLVVDRRGDNSTAGYSKSASRVSAMMNLEPDQLIIQKLSDNLLDIDITIILGADYQSIIKNMKKGNTAVDS
jgi:hypothetical protein